MVGLATLLGVRGVWDVGFRVQEVMVILGLLLLLGAVLAIPLLWLAGVIVLIVGLALLVVGRSGRQIGGRAHYW